MQRQISSSADKDSLVAFLNNKRPPYVVSILDGKPRSIMQNKLQRLWLNEAAEQLGEYTAEEYRAYCKLHFAIPILRNENDEFRAAYDKHIRPQNYETKLAMMAIPLDFPCTRIMTTKQKARYLDDIYQHFFGLGVLLTEPESEV